MVKNMTLEERVAELEKQVARLTMASGIDAPEKRADRIIAEHGFGARAVMVAEATDAPAAKIIKDRLKAWATDPR